MLDAYERLDGPSGLAGSDRDALISRYSFAVPTDEALRLIARQSSGGVVEVGAGTGYWARLLHERGVDVVAYDLFPPPSSANRWFGGSNVWYPVGAGDESVVERHGDRTLLLVWPTRKEAWASRAALLFHGAGGRRLVFVGEGPGGRTGDDSLQAVLGALDRCWTCAYGLVDAPCICDVRALWRQSACVQLPHWHGMYDDLYVYERLEVRS